MHRFRSKDSTTSEKQMTKLFADLTSEQADLCGLILSASGIAYTVVRSNARWEIWVRQADTDNAIAKISAYFRENSLSPERSLAPSLNLVDTYTGVYAALALMVLHWMIYYHNAKNNMVAAFGGDTGLILKGELSRAVTALMLHADFLHLMGNMVGIALFGTAVCSVVRTGPGWLLILLSGIFGNLANAILRGPDHLFVGASTAVFGAIGLISAFQFWRKFREPGHRLRSWLPVAGGIALLGLLGAGGGRTDLMAHLFGLLAGLFLGSGYSVLARQPVSDRIQHVCWWVTTGILFVAWFQ